MVDSLTLAAMLTREDYISLVKMQEELFQRQDKMADDLRQETNNIINKVNGWIGFWIAVMALLGVFVPIVMQYKKDHEFKALADECKEDMKQAKEEMFTVTGQKNKSLEYKFAEEKEKLQKLKKDIFKESKESISKIRYLEPKLDMRNFITLFENKDVADTECRGRILKADWENIVRKFEKLCEEFTKEDKGSERMEMAAMLVELTTAVRTMSDCSDHRHTRRLHAVADRLSTTIEILATPTSSQADINRHLEDLLSRLFFIQIELVD